MKRRTFLNSLSATSLSFLGLQNYLAAQQEGRVITPYGPLIPDPAGLLDLPSGFSYKVISSSGEDMDNGLIVPQKPDGMAAFPGPGGRVILIRNHELPFSAFFNGPFRSANFPAGLDMDLAYDPGIDGNLPQLGGTTTIVYNPVTQKTERQFLSLVGTDRNCAGGAMPWGSWITCEEPADLTSERGQKHGYCFEVKATTDGQLQKAVPLKALGRFCHEAVALDPETGILYLTEDVNDSLLYRFVPERPRDFHHGKLQALALKQKAKADLRNYDHIDCPEGSDYEVEWIDLDDVTSPANDLRIRGRQQGAACFARGEGIIYDDGHLYVCCTDGGPKRQGQIFRLTPGRKGRADRLRLFLQPEESDLLTNGDNLCASPSGHLIVCEDLINEHKENTPHIRGITPDGHIYTIARNAKNKSEFAGTCFSPDGRILFVNMQGLGHTLAITGPWTS